MGQLLEQTFCFLVKINQVRVNGGSNYVYPGQRWVPTLVNYVNVYVCMQEGCVGKTTSDMVIVIKQFMVKTYDES